MGQQIEDVCTQRPCIGDQAPIGSLFSKDAALRVDVESDGDCMLESLSVAIHHGVPSFAVELREELKKEVGDNKDYPSRLLLQQNVNPIHHTLCILLPPPITITLSSLRATVNIQRCQVSPSFITVKKETNPLCIAHQMQRS